MIHICPESSTPVCCRAESSHALEELRRQLEARLVCPMSTPHVLPGSFCDLPRGQTADNNCQTVFGRSRDNDDGGGREHAGWLVGFRTGQTHFAGVTGTKAARAMSRCCMIWSFHLYGRGILSSCERPRFKFHCWALMGDFVLVSVRRPRLLSTLALRRYGGGGKRARWVGPINESPAPKA